MTAKECAIDLIKTYVLRGDTLQSLKAGMLGYCSSDYSAGISGYINGKKYNSDFILVTEINHIEVNEIFKLEQIYQEIKTGSQQLALF